MLVSYSLVFGPIHACVYNDEAAWNVLIQLNGYERFCREIPDLAAAQNIAISYAHELCIDNELNDPCFLNAPQWAVARSLMQM